MNIKVVIIFVCMLMLATVFPAIGIKIDVKNEGKNFTNLQQPTGVSFFQIGYDWTKTMYLNSSTGEILIDIENLTAATGLNSGYINVYTSEGWVVQNLEIIEDFPYTTAGTYFDLGQDGYIDNIGAYVEYTELPLLSFEYSGALPPHPIGYIMINPEGGDIDGFIELPRVQPPSTTNLPGQEGFNEFGVNTHCVQKEHPNIECAHMQCVPMAYANNLQYLEDWFGVYVPDDHIPGVGGVPSNSLVGRLDLKMGRPSVSRQNGSGCGYNNSVDGLLDYTYFNLLDIDIYHQGWRGDKDVKYEDTGIISYGKGLQITFEFIYEEVCKGSAVELMMGYYNLTNRTGGHAVQIVAAGYVYDVPYVYFLDDRNQVSEKNPTWDNIGTAGPPLRRWLIDTDNDGMYNLVEDPESYDLPPEVECIYVQDPRNDAPLKPTRPAGGDLIMKKGVIYGFTSKAMDPNGDSLWYWFDWGDGTNSSWVGPYNSGDEGGSLHAWTQSGLFMIRAKAKDMDGVESPWSDPRLVIMPKAKMLTGLNNNLLKQIISLFFQFLDRKITTNYLIN